MRHVVQQQGSTPIPAPLLPIPSHKWPPLPHGPHQKADDAQLPLGPRLLQHVLNLLLQRRKEGGGCKH